MEKFTHEGSGEEFNLLIGRIETDLKRLLAGHVLLESGSLTAAGLTHIANRRAEIANKYLPAAEQLEGATNDFLNEEGVEDKLTTQLINPKDLQGQIKDLLAAQEMVTKAEVIEGIEQYINRALRGGSHGRTWGSNRDRMDYIDIAQRELMAEIREKYLPVNTKEDEDDKA